TPSPEALARLRTAVDNAPAARQPRQQQQQQQPARASGDGSRNESEKSRFGINSLINRMTGHGTESAGRGGGQQPARQQPPVQSDRAQPQYEDETDPDQDRIEIPAFLRRQAN
ncbi:MAG: cell division protein FtsZ, partial [Sediminimonas sp.]|nr:cell division protein FtsZ [Sediminimonas sp.]